MSLASREREWQRKVRAPVSPRNPTWKDVCLRGAPPLSPSEWKLLREWQRIHLESYLAYSFESALLRTFTEIDFAYQSPISYDRQTLPNPDPNLEVDSQAVATPSEGDTKLGGQEAAQEG